MFPIQFRSILFTLILMLDALGRCYALNVYDVIQLSRKDYKDQNILTLIEDTGSAFVLNKEDILRLLDLGVSEPVIQAMLKATPTELPTNLSGQSGPSSQGRSMIENHRGITEHNRRPPTIATIHPIRKKSVGAVSFASELYEEEASGGHSHRAIKMSGLQLLVIRDEGQYPSVAARARAVADNLNEAASIGAGTFRSTHIAGSDTVIFYSHEPQRSVTVISVSSRDAHAYEKRSSRSVTPDQLATYWSDLFSDYWSVAIDRKPPTRLINFHEGEVLQTLYIRLTAEKVLDASALQSIIQALPRQERDHLLHLATSMPRDF